MDPLFENQVLMNRRHFFGRTCGTVGTAALAHLLNKDLFGDQSSFSEGVTSGLPGLPHFAPRAKRVIYLFQSGAPSQLDLFDYKPQLKDRRATELPDSIRQGQRLTGMTATQASFPVAPTIFDFKQHGQSGAWVSELMPHIAEIADDLCFVKTMHTEAINHDPAITFFQTGFQIAGRPSVGSWLSYGLGTMNQDLPSFVVMISSGPFKGQPLYDRLWGAGFLPTRYQGVKFRSVGDPVLYLSNPPGVDKGARRRFLDDLSSMNDLTLRDFGDPEVSTRISQYEMAYRMQSSVPELTDLSKEPEQTFELYGQDARKPGTYASNCLLARRLAERDVRFIQLFHRGWDHHVGLPENIRGQSKSVDQGTAALIRDLKQRGLLDETLVIWGGEFGRTVYSQGELTEDDYGRDHHPRAFTIFMAGGGIKPGMTYGETDDFSYNIVDKPVHVHDLNATMLKLLGVDHTKLTFKYQGRHFRLTDVHGNVINDVLS